MAWPAKTLISCPVCGSDDFSVVYEPWSREADPARLYGASASIQGTQRMVDCGQCGLMYENPRYPADVILRGYAASDDGDNGHSNQYDMRVGSFTRALKRLQPHLPAKGARILDIGSAGGAFLEAAGHFGYDAWGMEPSAFRVAKGRERGLQIEQGVIENHNFIAESFDMVTLWDVIEHLPDPLDALRRVKPLLKPGGTLLLNHRTSIPGRRGSPAGISGGSSRRISRNFPHRPLPKFAGVPVFGPFISRAIGNPCNSAISSGWRRPITKFRLWDLQKG